MVRFTPSDAFKAYNLLKEKADSECLLGSFPVAWDAVVEAVSLIQVFNWEYSDQKLEKVIQQISEAWIPVIPSEYEVIPDRVVVLDDWCTSYVLILQYIEALAAAGRDILYITSQNPEDIARGSVFDRIKRYPRSRAIAFPSKSIQSTEWCRKVYSCVTEFRPEKVIAHINSSSRFLCILARLPKGITRYRSNLDDQCFWLGTSAIDYSLEFRPFGVAVSRERRGINENRQLYVPFYPIHDGYSFQGFPDLPAGCVKIFSGGDFYKTLDPDLTYWDLIKRILIDNPKAVMLYATKNVLGKTNDFIHSFVLDNHLEQQFFHIGFRKDIYEVFAHCDIFLGTTPVCGSLTSQLAAVNHKPILQYYLPETDDDETEQAVLYNNPELQISFTDKGAFLSEARRLIEDEEYRRQKGEELYRAMESVEQFNAEFIHAITTNRAPCPVKTVNYAEVERRWWWPVQMGFVNPLSYLPAILKRFGLLRKFPALKFKYVWWRYINQKLLSIAWYKHKLLGR